MQEHGGSVVNMTADFRNGMPGMGHWGAARAGMSNLTMSAAFEWAQAGVRVNAVAPGWVASSGMDSYGGAVRAMIPKLRQHVPMRRLATEAEISAAIVFCSVLAQPSSAGSRCRSMARRTRQPGLPHHGTRPLPALRRLSSRPDAGGAEPMTAPCAPSSTRAATPFAAMPSAWPNGWRRCRPCRKRW